MQGIAAVMRDVTIRFAEIRSLKQKLAERTTRHAVKDHARPHSTSRGRLIRATRVSWVFSCIGYP